MESTDVKFRLDVFEGPLDLLLHLIKTNELEISEISISKITSQYLEYLRLMETMDLEVAGDYLVLAATLINIKLRALLPSAEEEIEEEGEDLDDFMSAKLLMQRLIEYRRFKEAAQQLGRQGERQARIFVRDVALPKLAEAGEDAALQGDLELLLTAFARVIRFVDRRDFHEVHGEEFTVEEKIALLRRQMVLEDRFRLSRLFEQCRGRLEAIVTLMGVLELCRLKELRVVQGDNFDEILLLARRPSDTAQEEDLADQARQAQQLEAEILAQRTGLVDDGELPDPDAEVEAMLDDVAAAPPQAQPGAEPDAARSPTPPGARIIDLASGDETPQGSEAR